MDRIHSEFVFRDQPIDPHYEPSNYVSLKYNSSGSNIYGQIILPDERFPGPHPCVLLWHGFPGAVAVDDLAHALSRAGCITVVAHYRGSWGSEGKYLITHDIEDVRNLATYMREVGPDKYWVDPDNIYLFGHSIGGCASLNALRKLPWIRGLILMAPYNPVAYLDQDGGERLRALLEYGEILQSDGIDAMFNDVVENRDDIDFATAFDAVKDKHLCLMYGSLDQLAPPADMVFPLWEQIQDYREASNLKKFKGLLTGTEIRVVSKDDPIQIMCAYPVPHGLYGVRTTVAYDAAEFIRHSLR